MKGYGVRREDFGCCPGHDLFPKDKYNSRRSQRARAKGVKMSHQMGRSRLERELREEIDITAFSSDW